MLGLSMPAVAAHKRGGGGAAPVVPVKWNPADKSAQATVSPDGYTVSTTQGDLYANVRSTVAKSTLKRYFEFDSVNPADAGANANVDVGVATGAWVGPATEDGNTGYLGQDATSHSYVDYGDVWILNATNTPPSTYDTGKPYGTGERCGICVDFATGKGWVRDSTGWDGDPAAGTNPSFTFTPGTPFYIAATLWSGAAPAETSATIYTIASAFSYAMPAGAVAWSV